MQLKKVPIEVIQMQYILAYFIFNLLHTKMDQTVISTFISPSKLTRF